MFDLYAIECGFWPWVSKRKAGDALREMQARHSAEMAAMVEHAERVRWNQCQEIADLKRQLT